MEVNKPENIFFVLYSNQSISELEKYVEKYFNYKMHEFPKSEIDEEDQNKLKNNIENLKKKKYLIIVYMVMDFIIIQI
jgi:secreted Zn-dependent insulinase-like peptidase